MAHLAEAVDPIAFAVRTGLESAQKTLPPWLFYDEHGSHLFEQITTLPEYYLTRTERALLEAHADEILSLMGREVTIVELGAGTATKTGVVLRAAHRVQERLLYQPIDISPTALSEARTEIEAHIPGVTVQSQVANYITDPYRIDRESDRAVLALYIGSSIGNFSPEEARGILANLRRQIRPGDALLLGTDLAPSPKKSVAALLAAYDDAQGVTAAFNRNILTRLNRDLSANFAADGFRHQARWNASESRIEMHLESLTKQTVHLPANSSGPDLKLQLAQGETIHTENSYKFTAETIDAMLVPSGFTALRTFQDPDNFFAVTLASAT